MAFPSDAVAGDLYQPSSPDGPTYICRGGGRWDLFVNTDTVDLSNYYTKAQSDANYDAAGAAAARQAHSANLDSWSALAPSAKQDASANLSSWSALAPAAKQDASANLDSWSALAPSAKQDALGFTPPPNTRQVVGGGIATGGGALSADQIITVAKTTQAEALDGTDDSHAMTAARVRDAMGVALINTQAGSYTLAIDDALSKIVEMNSASANALTIPPNSSVAFSVGTTILVHQYGAGQTTFTPGSGVTMRSSGGKNKTYGQYSTAILYKRAADEWVLAGDIA